MYTVDSLREEFVKLCEANDLKSRMADHMMYIVSYIRTTAVMNGLDPREVVIPMHWRTLVSIISYRSAHKIVDVMMKEGLIHTNGSYREGYRSRRYSIKPELADLKWRLADLDLDVKCPYLRKNIIKRQKAAKEALKNAPDGYKVAIKYAKKVDINKKKAMEVIEDMDATEEKKEAYRISVNLLADKKYHSHVSTLTDRLYTNLSSFPRSLRDTLTIGRRRMMSVDIPNCQPLLLGLILKDEGKVDAEEVNNYLNICLDAQFYEHMAEVAGDSLDLSNEDTRANFKRRIFAGVLFDRNRKKLSKYEEAFQKAFPTIFNRVRELKRYKHNTVAILLQKEESRIIYEVVERSQGHEDSPVTAIHDCIVGDYKNIELIKYNMEDVFLEYYGLYPKLKIEKL